jgi:phosphoenolpyruvate carboxylase
LIWFIICKKPFQSRVIKNAIINLVFAWGDRDGNPFVTTEITLKVRLT